MNFELKTLNLETLPQAKTDALWVLVQPGFKPVGEDPLSSLISLALSHGDLGLKPKQLVAHHRPVSFAATRVYLVSVPDASPKAAFAALRGLVDSAKTQGATQISVALTYAVDEAFVQQFVTALGEQFYQYTASLGEAAAAAKQATAFKKCTLLAPNAKLVRKAFAVAQATVAGQAFAKTWGDRPGNYATPKLLAEAAQELAQRGGFACQVLGPKEVTKLKMGAFLGVAKGSEEPLRFIELRYEGAAKNSAPTVLVGKGVTFDSGGISIKPAAEMDEMKFDMCGAAAVLGTFEALALLRPNINVVGLIPACENLPSGRALKPGDVVTSMDGQTIEVLNTDAEGRLILCDALTYAKTFKPDAIIDIATLTGACVVALGGIRSGLFANDDDLAVALQRAGDKTADVCWRLPLDEDYSEGLKSNFADVANLAGRGAGSVVAAKFLQRFVGTTKWAHLDIAGTAWKGGSAKGATGRPVPLLVAYLLARAGGQ